MEPPEDQIVALQARNFEQMPFLPASALESLITEEFVWNILKTSAIEVWNQDEIAHVVMSGARRIFAILVLQNKVHLISKFIRNDQFQAGKLDAKLPLPEPLLESLLGKAAGRWFWTSQWMFIAPIFRPDLSHRKLEDSVVLPFVDSKPVGEGAFGVVTKIELHKKHQEIQCVSQDSPAVVLVRKCIQLSSPSDANHEQEGNVLSALRLIQHPNIVRLVATFEYRRTYNLLFEPADRSLDDFFGLDSRPPLWHDDNTFFTAIQGLSSALAALHDYRISRLNFENIGCHHDLKPANILVKDKRFLLADFGLSRLKPVEGDSKTLFRGMNYHNAPECLDFDSGYESLQIGRKSDIWALGTIMLDIVTYMLRGSQGLREFQQGRKHKSGAVTFYYFHKGGEDHPFVHSHVEELKEKAPPSWKPVFSLILSTLHIDPASRPDAAVLLQSFNYAALRIQTLSVLSRLHTYATSVQDNLVEMELKTYKAWTILVGLSQKAEDWASVTKVTHNGVDFLKLSECLSELERALNGLETTGLNPTSWSIRQLSRPIGLLVAELNYVTRAKLYNHIDIEYLQDIEGSRWDISNTKLHSEKPSLFVLAKAKAIAQHQDPQILGLSPSLELDSRTIKARHTFGSQSEVATLRVQTQTPVLIEYIEYNHRWIGDVREELLQRVQALASVLQLNPKPAGFSTLHCVGFYHAKERNSFGLVFDFPTSTSQLKTLNQLLDEIPVQNTAARPSLGDMFKLSRALAQSILQFHKVSWLHKDISSLNICFACTTTSAKTADITRPYLIGFNHSRPNSPDAFTHGPSENFEQKDYSHPDYLRDEKRFRYVYDYYSLGLVLLEIGLWRPLKTLAASMRDKKDQSPESLRKYLLERYVPRLATTMGSIYKHVVERCLDSDFPEEDSSAYENILMSILESFEDNVLAPLSTCNA